MEPITPTQDVSTDDIPLLPVTHSDISVLQDNKKTLEESLGPRDTLIKQVASSEQPKGRPSTLEVAAALTTYCLSSILMTVTNKHVLSNLHFEQNFLLLAIQSLVCVMLLFLFRLLGLLCFRSLKWREARAWMPVATLLVIMIYTSSKAVQHLPVAVFTIFKNISIILIAMGDVRWFDGRMTPLMLISFALIIGSAVLGGIADLTFNIRGYLWMLSNCLASAAFVLYMRGAIRSVGFADFDTVLYNNALSVPLLLLASAVSESWRIKSFDIVDSTSSPVWLALLIAVSAVATFFISFGSAWSIRVSSSTTYSMVGALNKLPVAVSGMLLFPTERNVSLLNILSIVLAFVSGIVYSVAQWQLKKQSVG